MIALIIDGSPTSKNVEVVLKKMGCSVQIAQNGSAGILEAVTWAPHLALISISLTDIDCVDVAKALRQFPETADMILIATAEDDMPIMDSYNNSFFDGQLTLASDEQLQSTVQTLITNSRISRASTPRLPKTDDAPRIGPPELKKKSTVAEFKSSVRMTKISENGVLPPLKARVLHKPQGSTSFARWGALGRWTAIPSIMTENLRAAGAEVVSAHEMEAFMDQDK